MGVLLWSWIGFTWSGLVWLTHFLFCSYAFSSWDQLKQHAVQGQGVCARGKRSQRQIAPVDLETLLAQNVFPGSPRVGRKEAPTVSMRTLYRKTPSATTTSAFVLRE